MGESGARRGEASSPFSLFLSNGGLTLVQRRVSFGEKWHEGSEREHRQPDRGKSINSVGAAGIQCSGGRGKTIPMQG